MFTQVKLKLPDFTVFHSARLFTRPDKYMMIYSKGVRPELSEQRTMGVAGWKLGSVGSAFFALAALAQPVAADPIYHLGPGTQYSPGTAAGTFSIPSVAEGIVFYLDADNPPTEITLTGLFNTSGEKVRCIAVTRFAFACSAEAALHAHQGDHDDEGQLNGRGANSDGSLTQLLNSSGDDPASLFQTASIGNDPPAGPASVPEPGSLLLLASALISFGIAGRRRSPRN